MHLSSTLVSVYLLFVLFVIPALCADVAPFLGHATRSVAAEKGALPEVSAAKEKLGRASREESDLDAREMFWKQPRAMTTRDSTHGQDCVYTAALYLSTVGGKPAVNGRVSVYDPDTFESTSFAAVPLDIIVDPLGPTLFVSTPPGIQVISLNEYMKLGTQACANGEFYNLENLASMTYDRKSKTFFFVVDNKICVATPATTIPGCLEVNITGGDIFNDVLFIPGGDYVFATLLNRAEVYAFVVAEGSVGISSIAWVHTLSENVTITGTDHLCVAQGSRVSALIDRDGLIVKQGLSYGPDSHLYLGMRFTDEMPCAFIVLDSLQGTELGCYIPDNWWDATRLSQMQHLAYSAITNTHYTLRPSWFGEGHSFVWALKLGGTIRPNNYTYLYLENAYRASPDLANLTTLDAGPCTRDSLSPSPAVNTNNNVAAIVGSTVAGSVAIGLVVIALAVFLLLIYARRRRRYYEGKDDEENGQGLEQMAKYTFREINASELKLGRILGQGAFGKVFKGEYRGAEVAVKLFDALKLNQADEKLLNEMRAEAQMMEKLSNHPNIVKFVGAITRGDDTACFALVTEFCPRGSLHDLLVVKKKRMPLITLIRMARDAAAGILHLHKERIIHRDIAARNILVGKNYEVYAADFGMARMQIAEGQAATTKQNFGPIAWMAPEALRQREYSEATDVFSFGVLLWEMVTKKRPWAGMDPVQIISAVSNNTRLKIPKDCDPVLSQLMKQCWRHNPAQRPSMEKVNQVLSKYYKNLSKIQGDGGDSDDSDEDSQDDMDLGEAMDFVQYQRTRIKQEVVSFLKQLISERSEDYTLIEESLNEAFHEVKGTLARERAGEDDQYAISDSEDDDNHIPAARKISKSHKYASFSSREPTQPSAACEGSNEDITFSYASFSPRAQPVPQQSIPVAASVPYQTLSVNGETTEPLSSEYATIDD